MVRLIVNEYEKALLFQKGRLMRVLDPGQYRIWKLFKRQRVEIVDMRLRGRVINGQEIMTADKVTLRMNVMMTYKVVDPVAAVLKVEDYAAQLYGDAQMALRAEITAQTLDELLARKGAIGPRV